MAGNFQTVKDAIAASARFVRVYPLMSVVAAVVYTASALFSIRFLAPLAPHNWTGSQVLSWVGSVPQIVFLAPVWTALLRFVILKDGSRRYWPWDTRVRRVMLVTLILSAILTAGGVLFALSLDVLPHFAMRLLFARGAVVLALCAKLASWWLVMRLAIAPALAAAGTRPYPLDTSLSFTRRWFFTIFSVKFIIYAPLFALIGGLMALGGLGADLQTLLLARPLVVAAVTLVTALAELIDNAAMALVAVRIVRARKRDEEAEEEEA